MRAYRWNRCRLGVVCIGLISAAGCANPVRGTLPYGNPNKTPVAPALRLAEISNGTNQENDLSKTGNFFESFREDITNLPDRIIKDSKDTFSKANNMAALLLAGGASIAMNQGPDKNIAGYFERHDVFHGFTDRGFKTLGNPGFHFAAAGFWYMLSSDKQDEFNGERAWTMITALSVTGLTTMGLKGIRNNDTPNNGSWAWPSGHTSSSFTVAAVLDEFYGPKVGIPAYALASLVGLRMMDAGDHWGSDVVLGATLGWVVGHTIAGKHKQLEIAGFKVLPYTASNGRPVIGVNLVKRF